MLQIQLYDQSKPMQLSLLTASNELSEARTEYKLLQRTCVDSWAQESYLHPELSELSHKVENSPPELSDKQMY